MSSSLQNTKVSDTYKSLLHVSDQLGDEKSVVYDGIGNASSLSVGLSGSGLDIAGDVNIGGNTTITSSLSVGQLLLSGYDINGLKFYETNSDVSFKVEKEVRMGSIRVEDSALNYNIILGDSESLSDTEMWVIESDSNTNEFAIKRGLSDTDKPLVIDRTTGFVTIDKLNLKTTPSIETPTAPTLSGDLLVLGNFTGANTSLSTVSSSGYQKLPSGLIIQWGTLPVLSSSNGTNGTFLTAFPTAAINITCTPTDDYSVGSKYMGGTYSKIINSSTFKAKIVCGNDGTSMNGIVNWQAIGW